MGPTVTLTVAEPLPVTEVGVIFAVAPEGRPVTLRPTDPAKPLRAATVSV